MYYYTYNKYTMLVSMLTHMLAPHTVFFPVQTQYFVKSSPYGNCWLQSHIDSLKSDLSTTISTLATGPAPQHPDEEALHSNLTSSVQQLGVLDPSIELSKV